MIRTLHIYLSRDLVRVGGLSLVAFTLVMSVFAIIEPLRKQGLSSSQALALFGYTVPVMLSLTLPVAALFAATIVYGRFSQENELMACRASGISALALLRPAWVLGGIITIASLLLSNFVSPRMAKMGEEAIQANMRAIAYQPIKTQGFVKAVPYIIHADMVDAEHDTLYGVVAVDTGQPKDLKIVVAPTAYIDFANYNGETYATIYLLNPGVTTSASYTFGMADSQSLESLPLPNPAREDPSWYDWKQLIEVYDNPALNRKITKELEDISRRVRHSILSKDVIKTINAGKPYDKFTREGETYIISADSAEITDEEVVRLLGVDREGVKVPVKVEVFRDKSLYQTVTADSGSVRPPSKMSYMLNDTFITIELEGNVTTIFAQEQAGPPPRREQWKAGQIRIPADVQKQIEKVTSADIYARTKEFTQDEKILGKVENLNSREIPKLRGKILAEMHGRVAYGVSCFLLVSMGAVLGLMFRGGQIISAFTLSIIPAAVVIIMILMGKALVSNPKVSTAVGLAAMWSGIVILLIGDIVVHLHTARK